MRNALETFKAQQEAAETLHARLTDVAALLSDLTVRVDRVRIGAELKATLDAEQRWLAQMQDLLRDVRRWRQWESHESRRKAVWRWSVAVAFALAVSTASGAGFVWGRQLYATELERMQSRATLADLVERRVATMTPAERQQFERLMNLPQSSRR